MSAKHDDQGQKVKLVGTHGKVLSQQTLMWNIKIIAKDRYRLKGLVTTNTHKKYRGPSTYHSKNTIGMVKVLNV
jgi:hypothetical protein